MKLVLILPYFGKFKSYFQLFLNSCKCNHNIDWIILTDNNLRVEDSTNIKVINITFEELVNRFQKKIPFEIKVSSPYKLCDYKPAYGFLFEEYINNYDYWGYCDCDMIFGHLMKYLYLPMNKGYDKIFVAGHLTIYKNNTVNNRRFLGNEQENLAVFNQTKTLGFDEPFFNRRNIHSIFLDSDARVYEQDYSANPAVKRSQFQLMRYIAEQKTFVEMPYKKTMYIWDNGVLKGLYVEAGKLKEVEYVYMHFQNRNMIMSPVGCKADWKRYYIVPNRFIPIKAIPTTISEWKSYNLEPANSQLLDITKMDMQYKWKRLKTIFFQKNRK